MSAQSTQTKPRAIRDMEERARFTTPRERAIDAAVFSTILNHRKITYGAPLSQRDMLALATVSPSFVERIRVAFQDAIYPWDFR